MCWIPPRISASPAVPHPDLSCGGGAGSVDVYKEQDADHYQLLGNIPSARNASTSHLAADQGRLRAIACRKKPAGSNSCLPNSVDSPRLPPGRQPNTHVTL